MNEIEAFFRSMQVMRFAWIASVIVMESLAIGSPSTRDDPSEDSYFQEVILPIFQAKCYSCHGPKAQKSSYRLDVREIAFQGGDHGVAPILPKNSASSLLFQFVTDAESELAMPPKESGLPRLTPKEIESLRIWIDHGAKWPDSANARGEDPLDWWSFRPLTRPEVSRRDSSASDNPIDHFVGEELANAGLSFSPQADPRTLARRVYFDLVGLPPSPNSLDEFEQQYRSDPEQALDTLIELLLATPQYGERWARHWLDVVHYGDTHGYDKDKPRPYAWPYRDYVIRALNSDKPYARFIEEQIAGDVLYPETVDGIEALGFIAAGPWDFIGHAELPESKTDGKIARHLDRDDMVSNTIGTFCSLTIHCAQCHQHKFDPITQEDYYRLHAVFSALDRTDRPYHRDDAIQQKFVEWTELKTSLAKELEKIEGILRERAGAEYDSLSQKIEESTQGQGKTPNRSLAFGYHSSITKNQADVKWVQIDLGSRIELRKVALRPCYDDFNSIGAGFGFPIRFRVEVCDDPMFRSGVITLGEKHSDRFSSDVKNPGLEPYTIQATKEEEVAGRYVRITASKLAKRSSDFHFALAELQVFDSSGKNVALGRQVSALDSVEAPPRWRRTNLTDGEYPTQTTNAERAQWLAERESLLLQFADAESKVRRQDLKNRLLQVDQDLKKLPAPSLIYAGGIHHGKGNFAGTGPSGGQPRPIFLLSRGQVTHPIREVLPGALSAFRFQEDSFPQSSSMSEGERRIALARWITDPGNPFTWRSIVNRVWLYHFGRGVVETPNDFGHNGGLPSHPKLLDWLAIEFRDKGGSLKQLHRLIIKSKTYRQSSLHHAQGESIDSDNRLLWRQNRRRLEAEAIRDSVLAVSGGLNLTMGGPGWQDFVIEHPEHSPHYEYSLADPMDVKTWRRSIYRFIVRSQTQPWMTSLDCADPSIRVDKRNESNSSIQALALLNNGFILAQSKVFAERVARSTEDISEQVALAHRLAFGSTPTESEREPLIAFAQQHGLPYLCRLFFNLNAFTFID